MNNKGMILARLSEPSTWAALAVLAGVFGVPLAPESVHGLVQVLAGLAAVAGVAMPESGK